MLLFHIKNRSGVGTILFSNTIRGLQEKNLITLSCINDKTRLIMQYVNLIVSFIYAIVLIMVWQNAENNHSTILFCLLSFLAFQLLFQLFFLIRKKGKCKGNYNDIYAYSFAPFRYYMELFFLYSSIILLLLFAIADLHYPYIFFIAVILFIILISLLFQIAEFLFFSTNWLKKIYFSRNDLRSEKNGSNKNREI